MDAGKLYIGLINNNAGNSIDDIALAAWENGYFPDKMERPSIDELKGAIRDELFGEKKYAYQQGQESILKDIQDLEQALDKLDIDYSNMSAVELEQAYNKAVNKYNAENNKVVEEDDNYNEDDYIPFQQSMDIAKQNEELDKVNPAYEGETINIDGVEKTVYNSNGDRIAMSEPALRNFYNWFGDSKVVDEQGRPLVVYHGTNAEFDVFKKEYAKSGQYIEGFFFTADKLAARMFGDIIMPVYLKAETDYRDSKKTGKKIDYIHPKNDDRNIYIVFSPNQIKSVENKGTFSKDNDNIYYQGQIAENNNGVELSINTKEEMQDMTEEEFKNKMIDTLKSLKGNKIFNKSLNANIEIRTSSIKKYKRFFADKNKRLIVPYIPKLLEIASFKSEKSYTPQTEQNVKNYWKTDIFINIDNKTHNVHLTVKEDDKGNFFWDAQIKENAQLAESVTITGAEGQSNDFSPDNTTISQSDTDVKTQFQGGENTENIIGSIDTSVFGDDMFTGFKKDSKHKTVQLEEKGNLKKFAETIADKIVSASDFAKSTISQSEKSEATYIYLYKEDADYSPYIKIRLATHKPIHRSSISTYYYNFNKTLKENMVELNKLIEGKEYNKTSTGKEQQKMIDTVYGEGSGLWGNAFSFEGLEDVYFQSSQDPRGAYHKDVIYLFERANASTFMHETAHWFKNELQKLGTERSAVMLKKVEEWSWGAICLYK